MTRKWLRILLATGVCSASLVASAQPVIIADLPATHSLVSMVMRGTGSPKLLVQGPASPHDYSLRPSQATSLHTADLLVWTSRELTPWLSRALQNSRKPVDQLELMNAPESVKLTYRQNNRFDAEHDHAHHEHADVADPAQPDNTRIDPHGWLDPVNGIYWLELIAEKLGTIDPPNASLYNSNAAAAQDQLRVLEQEIKGQLAPVAGLPFVVFHDSYHYFEERFGIFAQAAIALSDAELPGIRRMNELKEQIKEFESACLFSEPQFSDRLVDSLVRGLDVSTGTLDPLGTSLAPGPELYPRLLEQLASELESCLTSIDTD